MTNNVDLLSPFPQELVRKAPAGKFGDYVPHAHYVERLRDSEYNTLGNVNLYMVHTMVIKE